MSRVRNFTRNLVTSYLQLGVNAAYSLISIPLILYWLPRAEFGMWALLVQLMGYMALVDLGMTSATARLLVDHKDDRANGNYGSFLKASFIVSGGQALLILAIAAVAAPSLASLMNIPPEHKHVFILLLRMQGVVTAYTYVLRPLNLVLYAHQRMDLQTYYEIFTLLASLGLLVLFLSRGYGIISFVYANAIAALIGPVYLYWNCRRLRLLPRSGEWGPTTRKLFAELFGYGFQIFVFTLGCQLQFASQTIVVSRVLGLDYAASWAVGTKMFMLAFSLISRPYGAALPGLSEMVARGERERLKSRFRTLVQLTASLGALFGGTYILCNGLFVSLWTSGKIVWPTLNDALLAAWLFLISMQTTHCTFVSVTKRFGAMSYILLAEGCSFILLSLIAGKQWGLAGVAGCSVVCTALFSYQYGIRCSSKYFRCRFGEIAFDWIRPSIQMAVAYGLLIAGVFLSTGSLPLGWRLAIHGLASGTVGVALFLRLGVPPEILTATYLRLPAAMARVLQAVVGPEKKTANLAG